MVNPYTSRGGLQDARMFFGRAFELCEVGAFLNNNQSVSIVGPRKIGKTSLMLHLMRAETLAALSIREENLFAYIDCQALSTSKQDEIFRFFCIEIAAALHNLDQEPEPTLKAAVSAPTWSAFELAVRKLNQRRLRVVLMLDEFEQLTMNPHVDVSFYNALRSATGRLRLVYLTASVQPLIELTYFDQSKKILSSPFFNIFAQLFLGLLSESEARNLIRTPVEAAGLHASGRLEDFIYQLVGGHPFALQVACFHAWDNPEDLGTIELRTLQELEAHFQYYWHNLSPAERDALRHPAKASSEEASNPAVAIVLRDLTRKCLLVKRGESYSYSSKAWAEFVSAHLQDPVTGAPAKPPKGGSTGAQMPEEDVAPRSQEQTSVASETKKESAVRQVIRESLPEAIGGLVVAVLLGLGALINSQYPLIVQFVKSNYARIDWAWLMLAVIGFIAVGILGTRIALKRKQGMRSIKKPARGI